MVSPMKKKLDKIKELQSEVKRLEKVEYLMEKDPDILCKSPELLSSVGSRRLSFAKKDAFQNDTIFSKQDIHEDRWRLLDILKRRQERTLKKLKEPRDRHKQMTFHDHLNELLPHEEAGKPSPMSTYKIGYAYDENMKREVEHCDLEYHMKKNEIKMFAEATVRSKNTLRK
eukprot:TRINITY_DN12027_c0_g1_i1.p1 TRINITY_DN12027_c0_g1~~TRINITY_DN12027_c0_g1_i1.p1  ORF type:complete len:171 (+),score=39.49 TRINITY_DN12027_c0_g1_i1:292-804(+)